MIFWIEKEYKKEYISKSTGIRYKFDNGYDESYKKIIKSFIDYIRKEYYFPIRLNIVFCNQTHFINKNDGHKYYGVFFNGEESRKIYPKIYIAAKVNEKNPIEDIIFAVAHEITHYFQWYFLEDDKRTNRSLEIEANKWAKYILKNFFV